MSKTLSEITSKTLENVLRKGVEEFEDQKQGTRMKALDIEKLYRVQQRLKRDENESENISINGTPGPFYDTQFKDVKW